MGGSNGRGNPRFLAGQSWPTRTSKSEAATTGPAVCHWGSPCSVDLCTHRARGHTAVSRSPRPRTEHCVQLGSVSGCSLAVRLLRRRRVRPLRPLGERRGQRAAHCCFQVRTLTLGHHFQQNLPAWRPWLGLTLRRVWRWGLVGRRRHLYF